jgi:hypothetical protein
MESKPTNAQDKRSYASPTLIEYGSMVEITLDETKGKKPDGEFRRIGTIRIPLMSGVS